MDIFLNRLEMIYYNTLITKRIEKKEILLNQLIILVKYNRQFTDIINYIYSLDKDLFNEYINKINKPYLILLTYDLQGIADSINLSNDTFISIENNSFHVNFKPLSPCSDSSSLHSEWGRSK